MKKTKLFKGFLESLKNGKNNGLIESIKAGYALMEMGEVSEPSNLPFTTDGITLEGDDTDGDHVLVRGSWNVVIDVDKLANIPECAEKYNALHSLDIKSIDAELYISFANEISNVEWEMDDNGISYDQYLVVNGYDTGSAEDFTIDDHDITTVRFTKSDGTTLSLDDVTEQGPLDNAISSVDDLIKEIISNPVVNTAFMAKLDSIPVDGFDGYAEKVAEKDAEGELESRREDAAVSRYERQREAREDYYR